MDTTKFINQHWTTPSTVFDSSHKNRYVHTNIIQGNLNGVMGKLVQVRLKSGAFGSNVFLIREADGTLSSHENQSLCFISKEHYKELDELFKDVYEDDADEFEYSITGNDSKIGFIV